VTGVDDSLRSYSANTTRCNWTHTRRRRSRSSAFEHALATGDFEDDHVVDAGVAGDGLVRLVADADAAEVAEAGDTGDDDACERDHGSGDAPE